MSQPPPPPVPVGTRSDLAPLPAFLALLGDVLSLLGLYADRFILAREDADPDVLWNMEVFRSHEAKDAYEDSTLADQLRDEIIDRLAEPPMRIEVHPYSALPADPS